MAELERRMSAREVTEWMAFDSLEPIGEDRADLRAAIVAAAAANAGAMVAAATKGVRIKPFVPADFLLRFDEVRHGGARAPDDPFTRQAVEFAAQARARARAAKKRGVAQGADAE